MSRPRQNLILWLSRWQKGMPKQFAQILRDVKAEAWVDMMAYILSEAKFKTVNDILVNVKADALVHRLANTEAEWASATLDNLVVYVKTRVLVNTVFNTMAEAQEQTVSEKPGNVKA